MRKKKTAKRTNLIVLAVIAPLTLILIICLYFGQYYRATPEAEAVFREPSDSYIIETLSSGSYAFVPNAPIAGMIFYQGAKVQAEAYAPLMKACTEKGILCILVHAPGNFAMASINAAEKYRTYYPDIKHWFLAGHSLGGVCAAMCAANHPGHYDGLILLASYASKDLSGSELSVLLVYGSEDGVMNRKAFEKNTVNLPAKTEFFEIKGGNHAGFGNYGKQKNDNEALISSSEQIHITADKIASFIIQSLSIVNINTEAA